MQAEALAAVAAVVSGLGEADRAAPAVQADALRGALRAARDSTDAAARIATAGAPDGNDMPISLTECLHIFISFLHVSACELLM